MSNVYDTAARSQFQAALEDIRGVGSHWRSWVTLGWHDILHKYKGSVLGPFWITLNMAVLIGGLQLVYGGLFAMADPARYILYLSVSLPVWTFLSDCLQQGCFCYSVEPLIKSVRLPFTVYATRIIWRNLVVFVHNITIYVILGLIYGGHRPHLVLAALGMAIFVANLGWMIILLGTVCARFRDVAQIVGNFVGMLFLVSPVMWLPDLIQGGRRVILDYNIVNYLMDLVRTPLLGEVPEARSYGVCLAVLVLGWALTLVFFTKFRRRIAYWV